MLLLFVLLNILTISYNLGNVLTVPLNCPPGHQLANGGCIDTGTADASLLAQRRIPEANAIRVPPNCPEDQVYGNGTCRMPFRKSDGKLGGIPGGSQ